MFRWEIVGCSSFVWYSIQLFAFCTIQAGGNNIRDQCRHETSRQVQHSEKVESVSLLMKRSKSGIKGVCHAHQRCYEGDCCAHGSSCNTCPYGFHCASPACGSSRNVCQGNYEFQCKRRGVALPEAAFTTAERQPFPTYKPPPLGRRRTTTLPPPTPPTPAPPQPRSCTGTNTRAKCEKDYCMAIRGDTECIGGYCFCANKDECAVQSDQLWPLFRPVICMNPNKSKASSGGKRNLSNTMEVFSSPLWTPGALCFGREESDALTASSIAGPWKRTKMSKLTSGQFVMALDGHDQPFVDRVWGNLHLTDESEHELINIVHDSGTLTVTPDHVLLIDSVYKAARHARIGSSLSTAALLSPGCGLENVTSVRVRRIEYKRGRIVNPLTHRGLILAFGSTGGTGVAATTVVDSPHQAMLRAARLLFFGKTASYLFPQAFQRSSVMEHAILVVGGCLAEMPAWCGWCISVWADCLFGVLFIAVGIASKFVLCLTVIALASLLKFTEYSVCTEAAQCVHSCSPVPRFR